jgi:Raf kinase inhibitor-like YbhB/YbcL family protein
MLQKLPESIGHALQGRRAGLGKILFSRIDLRSGVARLEVSSLAFADHAPIPTRCTADGEALSPPLSWRGVPESATTLALIIEDADSPTPQPMVHALAVDIDPRCDALSEGDLRAEDGKVAAINLGRNSYLQQAWLPPDPPPGHGVHRYAFQLFALAAGDPFSDAPGREELAKAVRERALASGCLIGTYERDNSVKSGHLESSREQVLAAPAPLGAAT